MAEGRTSDVLCRYFVHGVCREGDQCHFSHDRERGKPDNVCRFYLRGCCVYGDNCRYDHVKPHNQASVPPQKNLPAKSPGPVREGNMTVLQKRKPADAAPKLDSRPPRWADAPEFVPARAAVPKSYASAVVPETDERREKKRPTELCPYALVRDQCPFGTACEQLHGNLCDMCGYACLHPFDEEQRKAHLQECMKEHERDMELSFAVARSKDKTCGICMDVVMEKLPPSERRFGILANCCHAYCLSCIRKWRNAKQFENKLIRSCPECRVTSDFITPSKYWVENKEDKDKLIADYQKAMSQKPCKYFNQGKGECPFGGKCFYLHAYPNGQKAQLPPPRHRKRHDANGDVDLVESVVLWDLFEERYSHWLLQLQLEDVFTDTDDDDDSEWSDFDLQD